MNKYLYEDLYELEEKHWWHIAKRTSVWQIAHKFLKVKHPTILDVGCGTGKNVEELSKLGTAWGLDSSREALRFCRKKRDLDNVRLGDAEKTRFDSRRFDLVTMLDVLEHTDDLKSLKEASRILKDDGLVLITVPAYQWMWSNWDVALHHRRRYTKGQLEKLFLACGFEVLKSTYLYSFLLPPVYLVRKIKNLFFKKTYPSDFKVGLPLVGIIFGFICSLERIVALSVGVPFGLSIIAVAKKSK